MSDSIEQIKQYAHSHDVPIMLDGGMEFICEFIKKHQICKILEIGTAIGYSAIKFASLCEKIKVVTIENDNSRYELAVQNITNAGFSKQITTINADALTVDLQKLGFDFDLIFIDAAKAQYINFFNRFASLLSKDGFIITDNLGFHGMVENPSLTHAYSTVKLIKKIRKYIAFLKSNEIYQTYFVEQGDGIAVTTMREEAKMDNGAKIQAKIATRNEIMKQNTIVSSRIILKPIDMADLFQIHDITGQTNQTIKYMMFMPHLNLDVTEEFVRFQMKQWDNFVEFISDKQNLKKIPKSLFFEIIFEDGIAGLVGVYFNISDNNSIIEAECAWIIAAHLQGRNLAARSAKKMIRFLSDIGVITFVAHCDNRNIQSISVAKKLGFELLSDNGCRIYPKTKEQATESCFVLKTKGNK